MGFADRFKRRRGLDAITGYSGGSLQDQLDNEPDATRPRRVNDLPMVSGTPTEDLAMMQPNVPQSPFAQRFAATIAPQPAVEPNQATRPRTTNPFAERLMNDPSRQERPREVNPTDDVTKSSDYIRQIQDKPLSLRDKAGLVAQNIATNLGGQPLATRRQRDLARAGEGLQRDLAVQGQQYKSRALQSQMDAREASARAAEERIRQGDDRLKETTRRNDAYIGHINDLPKEKQAEAARKMYMAGIADGDSELKSTLARRMGVTEELPDTDKGSIQVDDKGNYIVVHARTGGATPVTQTGPPSLTTPGVPPVKTPVGSFKATQENRKDERARKSRAAAMERTIVMANAQGARMGDPSVFENLASQADEDAKTAAALATDAGPRRAAPYLSQESQAKARAVKLRELATKARGGQSPQGTMQPSKRVFNESAFKAAFQTKHNRQPTEAEIAPYRNAP